MRKLLIFVDWFLPGYKAGGQIQSCANLASELRGEMDVYVVTSDRDMGDSHPYDAIVADEWTALAINLQVIYLSPKNRRFKFIQSIIRSLTPHCIYLNSMFSFSFTLLPIEVCRYNRLTTKIILAPRGMLHKGALQYKNLKKRIFFHAFKVRGFQKGIIFHATDATEESDIRKVFGKKVRVKLVRDFPASEQAPLCFTEKTIGSVNCLFVSRISPKKNLSYLLSLLHHVKAGISLSIVGPVENNAYWSECQEIIATVPSNIKIEYLGAIPNQQLKAVYQKNHLFVLPTHGENFGHVIFDALLYGRPVLVSDHTPWKNLYNKNIGWDIPLSDTALFVNAIENAAAWNQVEFNSICQASWSFASSYLQLGNLKKDYLQLFE